MALQIDNGGGFSSNKFVNFCKHKDIQTHFFDPYTPLQNGVVKRRNLAVVEMA
jgi:transposase InsO family protein